MARLPIPGQDEGQWGDLLNEFLGQSHTSSGALKDGVVASPQLVDGSVSELKLDSATRTKLNSSGGGSVGDATSTSKGVIQLAGDLTGTAAAPTVATGAITSAKIAASAAITKTQLATSVQSSLDKADTALQSAPPAPVSSVAGKTGAVTLVANDVGLGNVDNTSDATKPVSTPTQVALNSKADDTSVVHAAGDELIAGIKTFSTSPSVPTPTSGMQAATKAYVDTSNANTLQATSLTAKGDLLTATAPASVARLSAGTDGQILTADSTQATGLKWSTAVAAPVTSVAGKTGAVTLVEADVANLTTSLAAKVPVGRQVLAGNGLNGGGTLNTDQTLSVAFGSVAGTAAQGNDPRITGALQTSVAAAKGDLLAATAAATVSKVGVGTDGQILTADSTQATGLKWSTAVAAPVTSVAGKTGAVTLVEADVANLTTSLAAKVPVAATYATDPGVPRMKITNNYAIDANASNQTEIWTGPTMTSWTNEWGGYRCRVPESENWDAGLRIIAATTQTGKLMQVQNAARTVDLASISKDGTITSAAGVVAPNIGIPIRSVQATAPDTTGWQTNWFWYDTSTEV